MSDIAFSTVLNEVDSFSYKQCVTLLMRISQVLQNWTSKGADEELFYSQSNIEHIERGVKVQRWFQKAR